MWRICVVLLSVGLLAGCASSRRSEQVAALGADVADLRERMNELQEQVAELTAHREVAVCRLPNQVDASERSALLRFVLVRSAWKRCAHINLAFLSEAPARVVESRFVPDRSAPSSRAFARSVPAR